MPNIDFQPILESGKIDFQPMQNPAPVTSPFANNSNNIDFQPLQSTTPQAPLQGNVAENIYKPIGDFIKGASEGVESSGASLINSMFNPTAPTNMLGRFLQPKQTYNDFMAQQNAQPNLVQQGQQIISSPEAAGRFLGGLGIMGKGGEIPEVNPVEPMPKPIISGADDLVTLLTNPRQYVANIKETPVSQTTTPEGTTQLNAGLEASQPNYFDHQPITIDPNLSINENAQQIRNIHSSNINSTINEAGYLSEDVNKMLTPAENDAVGLARDFKKNPERIQEAIDSGKMDDQIPALKLALNPTENMLKADAMIEHAYNQAGNLLMEKKLLKGTKQHYINRLYEDRPVDNSSPVSMESYLQKGTKNALQRKYPDPLAAVEDGQTFKSFKASDRIEPYFADKTKLLADKDLIDTLVDTGIVRNMTPAMARKGNYIHFVNEQLPPEYMRHEDGTLVLDDKDNPIRDESKYYIPKELSAKLRAITDAPVDLAKIHPLFDKAQKVQDILKTTKLSMSLFHDKAMGLVHIYQNSLNPNSVLNLGKFYLKANKYLEGVDFRPNERDFVKHTGITTNVQSNADIITSISKNIPKLKNIVNKKGFKQALELQDKRSNFLFGKFQRILKVQDYAAKVNDWMSKNKNATPAEIEKAKTQIARQINAAYGGLNWEALGRTPLFKAISRFLLLAPDWTYSNIDFFRQAFLKNNAGGVISRASILSSAIGGGIATELLNYAINGHSTLLNNKGHEFETQLPNGQYLSFFPGQSGDAIKLYSKVPEQGVGGIAQFAQGKQNAIPQFMTIAGTGKNYWGQSISNNGIFGSGKDLNPLQKSGNYLQGVAQPFNPSPIGFLNSAMQLNANGEQNPLAYAPAMAGLTTVRPDTSNQRKFGY